MTSRLETLARQRSTQLVAGSVALVLLVVFVVWRSERLPTEAALVVDGSVVTQADLRRDVATLRAMYGVEPPRGEAKLDTFWRDAAQATAVSRVLDQAAEAEGVTVSPRKVDEALASYVQALYQGADDTQKQFTQALATAGTSKRAVEEEIRRRLVVAALTSRVTAQAPAPTDAEVADAFAARQCTLDVPERRRLRNIVVATRAEARTIRSDLDDGARFVDLARTRSADATTSESGGDLGTVARGQLESAYGKAAFDRPPGAVFGPVETSAGWNVGQVVAVDAPSKASYGTVRDALAQQLLLERQSALWKGWLQRRVASADVRYADRYEPDHPERLPAGVASWAEGQQDRCSPDAVSDQTAGRPKETP
ncbi:MAG: parvulin peptidyl-prolyl isomerase [Actinomycetales bacterium]|nr:MAG: parvulin peptidyl-prolyl isomerase [Actinomycetales bacterium]